MKITQAAAALEALNVYTPQMRTIDIPAIVNPLAAATLTEHELYGRRYEWPDGSALVSYGGHGMEPGIKRQDLEDATRVLKKHGEKCPAEFSTHEDIADLMCYQG